MTSGLQEPHEIRMGNHAGCGIDQRMRLDRVSFPEIPVNHELDFVVLGVVDEAEKADCAGRQPQVRQQSLGGSESKPPDTELLAQTSEVNRTRAGDRHQQMPPALAIAQEQVLGFCARQLGHQAIGFLDSHDRRVLAACEFDSVGR